MNVVSGMAVEIQPNQHRLDYPDYGRNGWQIGSRKNESSCWNIVAARLKCSEIRWRTHGTAAFCQLRALCKSELKAGRFTDKHSPGHNPLTFKIHTRLANFVAKIL